MANEQRRGPRVFRKAFQVLEHLAVNPRKTAHGIEKDTRLDRPTVYSAVRILETAGLVDVVEKKKLPTGLVRKKYVVTPRGVVALLQAHPDYVRLSKDYIRRLAEKNEAFLPRIFGKWNYFREREVEDLAHNFVLLGVHFTRDEVSRLLQVAKTMKAQPSFGTQECVHRHEIYEGVLVIPWTYNNKDAKTWLDTIRNDKELFETAENEILRVRAEREEGLNRLNEYIQMLHGQEELEFFFGLEDEEAAEQFREICQYERARAMDDGKPLPTLRDVLLDLIKHAPPKRKSIGGRRGMLPDLHQA